MEKILFALAFLLSQQSAFAAVPECRLNHQYDAVIQSTVQRALDAYRSAGREVPFDRAVANPPEAPTDVRTLSIFVVENAAEDGVDGSQCATRKFLKGDTLDRLSVTGACSVDSIERRAIRCSAQAVKLFAYAGDNTDRESPALLYVLSHEIGHVYQKTPAKYSGQILRITLGTDPKNNIEQLRTRCIPVDTSLETEADEYALAVLRAALPQSPYRERLFSEQGSLFWNIDLLALAADQWAQTSIEQEFMGKATLHKSFEPTKFPTPQKDIDLAAKRLVCEVAKKKTGIVVVPEISSSHPPAEERLRRIAEILKPEALKLPKTGGSQQFKPVTRLQQDLGPIFTQIYRETGVYMEALNVKICTRVNALDPVKDCK